MSRTRRQTNAQLFAVPAAVALFTAIGLVSALLGDGWRDWLSWAALSVPVGVTWWAMKARRG